MRTLSPRTRSCSLLVLSVVLSLVIGCDADTTLSPDVDVLLASRGGTGSAAPSDLSATAISPGRINLAWRDNSSNESGFEVHRSADGASGTFSLWATTGANATSASLTVESGREYCAKVRAFASAGKSSNTTYSEFSNTACARTPLAAPSNTSSKPRGSFAVEVTWTYGSFSGQSFRVERSRDLGSSWTSAGRTSSNARGFADEQALAEEQICHRVIAFAAEEESEPSNVACTTPPAMPTDLVASTAYPGISLTWTDNSAFEDGYEVRRVHGSTLPIVVAELPPNTTGYHDATVEIDTRYSYEVRAKKDGGFSHPSNTIGVSTSSPPNAPGWVDVSPVSSTGVGVLFDDGALNAEGFRIERSTDNGAIWTMVATVTYNVWFSDHERSPEHRVCYRVIAFNDLGDSPPATGCTTPPAAPTNLIAHAIDGAAVELTWTDNSGAEDGYEVQTCDWSGCDCRYDYGCDVAASLGANATSCRITPTTLYGETHRFFLVARKDGGYSDWVWVP